VKEDKTLKKTALYMFLIMTVMLCFVIALSHRVVPEKTPGNQEEQDLTQQSTEVTGVPTPTVVLQDMEAVAQGGHAGGTDAWELWQFLKYDSVEEMFPEFGEHCILIKKPAGGCTYEVEENLICHQIMFRISGEEFLNTESVLRVHEGNFFYGMAAAGDFLEEFGAFHIEENGIRITEFLFTPDGYYVPQVVEEEEYYVVNLLPYHEVYEKIVVLDAGHGGADPGAGAEGYTIQESKLALKCMLYLKEMLEEQGDIKVLCTRTTDTRLELAQRVELALGVEADLFVSFHFNASESKSRRGSEVIYNAKQGVGETFNSKVFARMCLDNLVAELGTKRNGLYDRQDLHIVRRSTMPIAYLETLYLSNKEDLALVKEEENLKKIAKAVYDAILAAYELMEE